MSRPRQLPPLAGGMRIVETEPPPDETVAADEAVEEHGSGGYWGFIGWCFHLLLALGALLGLIAGFWGLYLAASALWHAMGL